MLLFSQVGGEYFFLVTYWRPIVFLALFTRFLESVLRKKTKVEIDLETYVNIPFLFGMFRVSNELP